MINSAVTIINSANTVPSIASAKALLKSEAGSLVISSLDVANIFDKHHKNIIRTINSLKAKLDKETFKNYFYQTTYTDATGKTNTMFLMNKNGFALLVMSFNTNSHTALSWKIMILNAFDDVPNNKAEDKEKHINTEETNMVSSVLVRNAELALNMAKQIDANTKRLDDYEVKFKAIDTRMSDLYSCIKSVDKKVSNMLPAPTQKTIIPNSQNKNTVNNSNDDKVVENPIIKKYKNYTDDFRKEVINYCITHTEKETIDKYNVSRWSIFNWKKRFSCVKSDGNTQCSSNNIVINNDFDASWRDIEVKRIKLCIGTVKCLFNDDYKITASFIWHDIYNAIEKKYGFKFASEVQKLKAQWRKEGYDSVTISKCNKLDVIATNPEYIKTFIDIGLKIREYYYRKYNNYLIRNKDRVS